MKSTINVTGKAESLGPYLKASSKYTVTWLLSDSKDRDWPGLMTILVCSGCVKHRNLLSLSSGGWKSNIKVPSGLVPSEVCEGESGPGLCPGFWWFLAFFDVPCLVGASVTPVSASVFTGLSPCVHTCLLLIRTPVSVDQGLTLIQHEPISK